jgi:hypothetical protein
MTLIQSWIDSLTLLKPKNLQLFAMVTLKSIAEAYKLFIKYFWWLMVLLMVLFFIAPDYMVALRARDIPSIAHYISLAGLAYILYTLLFLSVCFATRPSIEKKNCHYFRGQYKRFIFYWLLWVVLFMVSAIKNLPVTPLFLITSYSPWYIFMVLFFADSAGGLKNLFLSMWHAMKMILFNFPLLAIMGIAFYVPIFIVGKYFFVSPMVGYLVGTLLLPIGVCTYANIYIKKLHDQFDLYVKQPQ